MAGKELSADTDKVLSAIRRGEDSLPKLRTATGLEYADLHLIVYQLENEWRSIHRQETADGAARYIPAAGERTNGSNGQTGTPQSVPPSAFRQTKLGNQARAVSLLQRDAPYCIQCRGICVVDRIGAEGQTRWRCLNCSESFDGTSQSVMAHIEPELEITATRERVSLGPAEEKALDNMRLRTSNQETLGDEEEAALALMRGGEPSEEEARIAAEIDRELSEEDDDEEVENWRIGMCRKCVEPAISKTGNVCQKHKDIEDAVIAPCIRCEAPTTAKIRNRRIGRCEECYKDLLKQQREAKKADQTPKTEESRPRCGCGRPNSHGGRCAFRRQTSPSLADELAESRRNTSKPLTINGDEAKVARFAPSDEGEKEAMPETRDIIPEKFQPPMAQVQVMGGVKLHEDIQIRVSEMRDWPADRISEFFAALEQVIEIPQRPLARKIKPAWPRDFEADNPDDVRGLTMCYLISMFHHDMEQHEKDAVWTLVQYLKRIEAYVEQERNHRRAS